MQVTKWRLQMSDELEFDAIVEDIRYVTNTKGRITPIIVLDKQYVAKTSNDEQPFDAIAFFEMNSLIEKECGIGASVHITCNEQLVPNVTETLIPSTDFRKPTKCMHCGEKLYTFNDSYHCINHLCMAQGRSAIFRLLIATSSILLSREDILAIHKYLNEFPHHKDTANVENIYTYLKLLHSVKARVGSQERQDELVEICKKNGKAVWLWEFTLLTAIENKLSNTHFWYTLGLPFKDSKDLKKLDKHDFVRRGRKKLPHLSDHGHKVLDDNAEYIKLFASVLKDFL